MKRPSSCAPIAVGVLLASCGAPPDAAETIWQEVTRGDLAIELEVTGALRATRWTGVGPPPATETWDFKIVRMATEGSLVKAGEPLLFFDPSELERRLLERIAERDLAAQEIAKKQVDLDLACRESDLQVAEAEAVYKKAALKADLPPQYTAAIEVKLARIDLERAEAEWKMAQQRRDFLSKLNDAEMAFLRERLARAESRVARVRRAIDSMTVLAPTGGLVVVRPDWRGDKKKVGDACWSGESCLEIVDVSELRGEGEVDETVAATLAIGQRARLRLEALPALEWEATVESIRPTVYRQSPRTPLKVVGVGLRLARTDPGAMRPGMQFRGRIEVDRVRDAVLLPLDAIAPGPRGPTTLRRTAVGEELVTPTLGRRNQTHAQVLDGLAAGDRIARPAAKDEAP